MRVYRASNTGIISAAPGHEAPMFIPTAAHPIARRLALAVIMGMIVTACQATPAPAPDLSEAAPSPVTNRIAVIEAGGPIYTLKPDGTDRIDRSLFVRRAVLRSIRAVAHVLVAGQPLPAASRDTARM